MCVRGCGPAREARPEDAPVTEPGPRSACPRVLAGREALIGSDPGMTVVASAHSAAEVRRLGDEAEPHVAVLDLQLPDGDGNWASSSSVAGPRCGC